MVPTNRKVSSHLISSLGVKHLTSLILWVLMKIFLERSKFEADVLINFEGMPLVGRGQLLRLLHILFPSLLLFHFLITKHLQAVRLRQDLIDVLG